MATTTQTNTSLGAPARPVDWGRWLAWLQAAALAAAGLVLLAGEAGLLPAAWQRPAAIGVPVVLMAVGGALAGWGWPGARRSLPGFAVERGAAARGELMVTAGGHDVAVRAFGGSSQLAAGEFPNLSGPVVAVAGSTAQLTLDERRCVPALAVGPWVVALAKGLPWALDLRAGGGRLDLNLRDLPVASLQAHSAYGDVALTLPGHGPAELTVHLGLGDLAVTVPDGVEARLRLRVGPLVRVVSTGQRLVNVAPNEWMTPLFPTTTQRCTVLIEMSAGDLQLN
jgi:hypothetical protein